MIWVPEPLLWPVIVPPDGREKISAVQANVAPTSGEFSGMSVVSPLQIVCGDAEPVAVGYTVNVNVFTGPMHPLIVAVTPTVATILLFVEFDAVNRGIFPLPDVPNPTFGLQTQLNVASADGLVKLTGPALPALQAVRSGGWLTTAVGETRNTTSSVEEQEFVPLEIVTVSLRVADPP